MVKYCQHSTEKRGFNSLIIVMISFVYPFLSLFSETFILVNVSIGM